jgi:hypothetical protein
VSVSLEHYFRTAGDMVRLMLASFDQSFFLGKSTGSLIGADRCFKGVDRSRFAIPFFDEILA